MGPAGRLGNAAEAGAAGEAAAGPRVAAGAAVDDGGAALPGLGCRLHAGAAGRGLAHGAVVALGAGGAKAGHPRSEEHTSELQSLMRISYAVFCLKKKNNKYRSHQQSLIHI